MRRVHALAATTVLMLLCSLLFLAGSLWAQEQAGLAGWEKGSEYNRYYDASEFDDFKGVVEDIMDIIPLPGMAPGVGLIVRDQDGDKVEVQLGPKSFVKVDGIGLRKGDKIKVKGVWVQINGKDVFMASKVKKGENMELKVRGTKSGVPYWTLSPEELAKEASE